MLNFNQVVRNHPDYSLFKKIMSVFDVDIYYADNIADYRKNAPKISYPWYKNLRTCMIRFIPSAYIIIQNVGLTKPKIGKFEIPDWVIVHDDTEREFVKWTADNPLFPTRQSYEEARIVQGLQDDDWVHDILLRYLIDYDFSTLVEVRKIKSCLKTAKEDSIVDMVKSFFPEFSPIPQPSYSAAQAFIF